MTAPLSWYETDPYGGRKAWHLDAVYLVYRHASEWVAETRVRDGFFARIALSPAEDDAKRACEDHAARRIAEPADAWQRVVGKDGAA